MRPGRPSAGHAAAGETGTLTDCSGDAPEALIEARLGRKSRAVGSEEGILSKGEGVEIEKNFSGGDRNETNGRARKNEVA